MKKCIYPPIFYSWQCGQFFEAAFRPLKYNKAVKWTNVACEKKKKKLMRQLSFSKTLVEVEALAACSLGMSAAAVAQCMLVLSQDRDFIKNIYCTCVFPAMTSLNVCCEDASVL